MTSFSRDSETTIAAIITARGAAGLAAIRLSGSQAWTIATQLVASSNQTSFEAGRFYHRWLQDPQTQEPLDEVLLLFFKGPQSFTGEDVVEIHGHGGDALIQRILNACFQLGAKPAGPGEFTKRRYLNGKLDLTQAESILDLISAQGERLLKLAAHNLKHRSLGGYIEALSAQVMTIQGEIVASVDFPDEVDEPDRGGLLSQLSALREQVQQWVQSAQQHRWVRDGLTIAILGRPNAGKSSLFNALLAQERAIVTPIAGTTRDVITEQWSIGGVPVQIVDTAGIRETENMIESLGIARSRDAAASAQLALVLYDVTLTESGQPHGDDLALLEEIPLDPKQILLIGNKIDELSSSEMASDLSTLLSTWGLKTDQAVTMIWVSARTGANLSQVTQWIEEQLTDGAKSQENVDSTLAVALTHRQLAGLEQVQHYLWSAEETLRQPAIPIDFVTVPLSDALRGLDDLIGKDPTEAVLDEVFSRFCVGK